MKEFNLLLAGHWGLNITVETNSKEEAIDNAMKLMDSAVKQIDELIEFTGEMSGSFNITHDKQWMEDEDGLVKCPDYDQLHSQPSGRFLH